MELSERQIEILQLIIKEQGYLTMQHIAKQMSVSYKTIANDVKELDDWLQKKGITLEKTPHKGICLILSPDKMEGLHQVLHYSASRDAYTSIKERRELILLSYLWNPEEYTSIQKLSTQYYVSNTSIIKDVELVEERLAHYAIKLKKSTKGTRILATEIDMRKALLDYMEAYLFDHMSENERYEALDDIFAKLTKQKLIGIEEILNYLESIMKDLETVSMKVINEPYYTNAFLYMTIMILRIRTGNCIRSKQELVFCDDEIDEIDFAFTKQLVHKIEEQYSLQISEAEAINIYRHLISGGLSKKEIAIVEQKTKENNLLSLTLAYTRYLIEHMSILFGIDFSNQVYLHSNLRFHVKPMLNRLRYDISISNMMLAEIKKRYPLEFACTLVSCLLTSRRYELPEPSEAEVAYVMVYFQSAMERNLHDIHALIVTGNSMGSAQLLKTRLENTFQDLYVKDIITPAKLNSVNMENIDVILSTAEVSINLPYVGISPFCDEADTLTIRHVIKQLKKQTIVEKRRKNPDIIEASIHIKDEDMLIVERKQRKIYLRKAEQAQLIEDRTAQCYMIQYHNLKEITPCLQFLLHSALPIN